MNHPPVTLPPCPFCEGPPSVIVAKSFAPFGAVDPHEAIGCDGLDVDAYVFCHECGAEGPKHEDIIFHADDFADVEQKGVALWIERTAKHRALYDAGTPEGLNTYPRATATGLPEGLLPQAQEGGA